MTDEQIVAFVKDAAGRATMAPSDWLRMRVVDAAHRPPPMTVTVHRDREVTFEVWKRAPLSTQPPELVETYRAPVFTQPMIGDVVLRASNGWHYSVVSRRHEAGGIVVELHHIADVTDRY